MKKRTVIILTLTIALLFGGCKHQAETSMSALFPSEINSIEVTFDIYPSEMLMYGKEASNRKQ